jgi:hypothetical protein
MFTNLWECEFCIKNILAEKEKYLGRLPDMGPIISQSIILRAFSHFFKKNEALTNIIE